jgi:DNA-binding FadR family transcriptional regulator
MAVLATKYSATMVQSSDEKVTAVPLILFGLFGVRGWSRRPPRGVRGELSKVLQSRASPHCLSSHARMASKQKSAGAEAARRKALRLHGSIARDLGVRIVSGRARPGDILDGEIDASDRLEVSRTAYREAVRILAAKGLVESRPKVGTRVSRPERWHWLDPDVLSWIFEREPDDRLLNDLFELRRMVEPQAAALAAGRRTEADLVAMAQALQAMEQHSLAVEEGRAADQKFHAALLRATGNAFVASLVSGIGAAVTWTTIFKQRHQQLARDPVPDHVRVYEAVRARNPAAAQRAMTALLDLALLDTTTARGARKSRVGIKAKR